MRIALVAPSPVPFTIGGAEKLWWGLQDAINTRTSHQCELFKIPTRENTFWDVIDSYSTFSTLDLSYFDMVISTKYPAWMVRHRNHTVYLQHHLRGLFDTYSFCNQPLALPDHLKTGLVETVSRLVLNPHPTEKDVDTVFEALRALKKEQTEYDAETFAFPGPFIRSLVHFFDASALAPERVRRYFAISRNVRGRADYFPRTVPVEVLYHPSRVEAYACTGYDYLFTVSRLDPPKRIDRLIEAMKYVPSDVHFKIAGTGPDEDRLKKMAGKDRRIEFLGYVGEDRVADLYAHALAVLYIPYDEDYGLITIEGMKSKKPVITATDSGGSLEFVTDNETGFAVDPDPAKIAEKITYFAEHPDEAQRMGGNAYEKVRGITWTNVVARLLDAPDRAPGPKKKILVLTTFSCHPPRGGGQQRVYHLYSRLARQYDVTICSIVEADKPYQDFILDSGLRQICIPQSDEHARSQWEAEARLKENLYDVCMIDHIETSKKYVDHVRDLIGQADFVIFSHPYLYPLRKYVDGSRTVVYEAHNVEYLLKKDSLRDERYHRRVFEIERSACLDSDAVLTTSEEDRRHLIDLYRLPPDRVSVAPNGVDPSRILFIDGETRRKQKEAITPSAKPQVLFVGSWHPPNLEALRYIAGTLAPRFKDWRFLVIGSVRDYYLQTVGALPKNVLAFGVVDEDEKYELYKLADVAVNPMFSGSGTNLKMLDYMSAGIPVISTPVGARGLDVEDHVHAAVCPAEKMPDRLAELLGTPELGETFRRNGRRLVEEKYSWDRIADGVAAVLEGLRP
jgi:glycosyltransferase involved in cell wall biosynthesis